MLPGAPGRVVSPDRELGGCDESMLFYTTVISESVMQHRVLAYWAAASRGYRGQPV